MKNEIRRQGFLKIACFISPHGYGHAARAAAVIEAVGTETACCRFEIFTTVPDWFFGDSLTVPYSWHPVSADIGLIQKDAFSEDIAGTLVALDAFLPFAPTLVENLARRLRTARCDLILCDIAPLGIAVGQRSGIPSVLIENFTWDRIYAGYAVADGAMARHITYLQRVFAAADHHIQTEPVCFRRAADLTVEPVSRRCRLSREAIRRELGVPAAHKIVLITTGGIAQRHAFLDQLRKNAGVTFLVPGASDATQRHDNLVLLPHRSEFFHPDLVNASDAVVGKVGYSTIAEVYAAGVPFGHVARISYPESPGLVDFISRRMEGVALSETEFNCGSWLAVLSKLLDLPRQKRRAVNGSEAIAGYIRKVLLHRGVSGLKTREKQGWRSTRGGRF
jgi:hypothetical protein